MFLETIEAEGLSHRSYLLGDDRAGVAAAIDPRRDVDVYLDAARRRQVRIAAILETHIHADFVSGSLELAARTGAPIHVGAADGYGFEHRELRDGESIELGSLTLRVLHTPGHTPEHVCYLVAGGAGAGMPWGVFTGDTLFAGDVGRPDLAADHPAEPLARQLYRSLHHTLLPLGDEIEVYPAHGRGSPCGLAIGDRATTTIGYERRHNPRLQERTEDAFVAALLGSNAPAPSYYARLKALNRRGADVLGRVPDVPLVDPVAFRAELDRENTIVVDTREVEAYGGAHIAGSINIALRPAFPLWAGEMLAPGQRILLVLAEPDDVDRVMRHLIRIGCDEVAGALRRGIRGWIDAGLPLRRTPQLSVHELRERLEDGEGRIQVLDVRTAPEWERDRIATAQHIPLAELVGRLHTLDPRRPVVVYCDSGFRTSIAASVLERGGFQRIHGVAGGIAGWRAAGYPVEGRRERG